MAYNEKLADRIRESIVHVSNVEEKQMFGGVCFMVNGKMCVGVVKDEMMCRINPEMDEAVLEIEGCRQMDFTGKKMKGYVFVSDVAMKTKKQMDYFINLSLEFNSLAKAAKKKKTRSKQSS